jgi:hypothetical protein
MRKTTMTFVAMLGLLAAPAFADGSVAFRYSLERGGDQVLRGFDLGDGPGLRVRLDRASYCYLLVRDAGGRWRLAVPDPKAKGPAATSERWAHVPRSTFLRFGESPTADAMLLVVASEPLPELERALATGDDRADQVARDLGGPFVGEGSYNRHLRGQTVSVSYRTRDRAVVVEEIALNSW